MSDGYVLHEWVDESGNSMRALRTPRAADEIKYVDLEYFDGEVWESALCISRRDAEQLLVAFDKLERAQNAAHGPLSVEIDGLPGRYLPGLEGQPVRVDTQP